MKKIPALLITTLFSSIGLLFFVPSLNYVYAQIPITDLGSLGGNYGVARGINDNGKIVGASSLSNQFGAGFIWENGNMTEIIGGSAPWQINNSSQVAGQDNGYGGFVWNNGSFTSIVPNILGGNYSAALDINSNNKVIGIANNRDNEYHAFTWDNGTVTDLGVAENLRGIIGGINDHDAVVAGETLWRNGQTTNIGFDGFRINNNDQIVGAYWLNGGDIYHAAFWDNGQMKDLGTLGGDNSEAQGINDHGQIVGASDTSNGEFHAVLWDKGQMIDLGGLGGTYVQAYDINNYGQIAGTSTDSNGNYHPVMWTLPPSADIKVNNSDGPVNINTNSTVTISWTSENTKSCEVSPAGFTGTSGVEESANLVSSISYTLSCTGPGGTINDSVTVNVNNPSPTPTPTATPTPTPTIQSIQSAVTQYIADGSITQLGSSLTNKLTQAQNQIDAGKYDEARATLQSFINQIKAQSGKHITKEVATQLIAQAQYLLNTLP